MAQPTNESPTLTPLLAHLQHHVMLLKRCPIHEHQNQAPARVTSEPARYEQLATAVVVEGE